MRIRELMTEDVAEVAPGTAAADARALMRARGVRHLVVREGARTVGVVSDRDLGGPRGRSPETTVARVMASRVVTIAPDATLRDAANLLRGHVIGCLPVIEGERLVGIVTISDVLDTLGRGGAPQRGRARPYVARRQGPLGKPRGERLRRR
jgi:acetoin utilization protein AcuB